LLSSGFECVRYAIQPGEEHKTLADWQGMLAFLAQQQLTRSDCIVALGGGIPGDMAGFAAACYLRGIKFVQVPTTLLAMVDSSVGGKTGINLPSGKNQLGAFYQPGAVFCDPDVLATLPPETLADGVSESIKYGMLGELDVFDWFETGEWTAHTEELIQRCIQAKARVVVEDERDTGCRQLLNLGHTFGHAIEKNSDYQITHGHGVAIGMVLAAKLAYQLGLCQQETVTRLAAALKRNHLPTETIYTAAQLANAALADKKRTGGTLTLVLPTGIGHCQLHPVEVIQLENLIALALET
jgi:3-dehydroquinate synthase